nr:Receptor-interacting serine/threonine-protein kinase 1 [Polyrhizophydium stewartii]
MHAGGRLASSQPAPVAARPGQPQLPPAASAGQPQPGPGIPSLVVARLRNVALLAPDVPANRDALAAVSRRAHAVVSSLSGMHAGAPQAVVELEKLLGILESLAQSLVRMSPLLQVLHSLSVAERLTAIDGQISDIALRYSLAIPVVGEIAIAIQSDIRQLSSLVGQIATNDIQAMQAPAMRIDTLFAISQYKSQILGVLAEPIREPFGLLLAATNDLIFSTTSRRLVEVRGISISPDGVDILWNEALAGRSLYGDCYKGFLRGESVDVQLIDGIDSHDLATALGRCVARLAKIDHPNLLKPLRVCLNSDRPFVITHPARRTALELLRDQPQLSLPQRISIIAQTAVALRQLHDFRLPAIHGGLCAECILLDDDGNVKLAYAGFAMLKLARVCYGQRRISTMRWIAPELFLRGNAPNVSTDIFAFGMTALHILAGVEPFSELAEQDAVIMSWVRDGLRPSRPQGIPDGIWYMIEGCLSAVPSMRPSLERIVACLEDKDNLVVRDTDAAFMPPIKMDPNVADNPIKEIPSTFTMLKRLEYLNVSNTNVSYISSKIRKLPGINLLFKNTPFQRRFESSDFEDSDDGDDDDDDHNRR